MTALDYILDGLEAELALERELGVRAVEIDRALLTAESAVEPPKPQVPAPAVVPRPVANEPAPVAPVVPTPQAPAPAQPRQEAKGSLPVVFVHDRPLSPGGVEMMAKIVTALGLTVEQSPVIVAPPIPNAGIFVFLGMAALRRYMPTMRLAENAWGKSPKGKDVLLVKSPEEILRFATVTPAVKQIKAAMWNSLKTIRQRLG